MIYALRFGVTGSKLVSYLLDPDHPVGGSKARFFIAHGFAVDDIDAFANALLDHVNNPRQEKASQFGLKYIIEGPMQMPSGASPVVRTVWLKKKEAETALLITAYPI